MARAGLLEEWLDATARSAQRPAVRFSSCFPVSGRDRLRGAAAQRLAARLAGAAGRAGALEERALRSAGDGAGHSGRADAGREPVDGGWRQRMPGAGRQARARSAWRALERGGGPADRRGRAAFHGVHRIPPRRRPVDGGFVSPTRRRARAGRTACKAAFRCWPIADSAASARAAGAAPRRRNSSKARCRK